MGQQFLNLHVHGSIKYHEITKGKLFWGEKIIGHFHRSADKHIRAIRTNVVQ
jgi:hypothetical protein